MKKALYLLLLFGAIACKHKNSHINPDIRNEIRGQHVRASSTRVYMIPPINFTADYINSGYSKGKRATITVYDLIGGNIAGGGINFTRAGFESRGMKVLDFQEVRVNGFKGMFAQLQAEPGIKQFQLLFGDSTFFTLVSAYYAADDERLGDQIIDAFNTICYDTTRKTTPDSYSSFRLDEKASRFKVAAFTPDEYTYTIDGKPNAGDGTEPVFLVKQFFFSDSMSFESITANAIETLKGDGLEQPVLKNLWKEKIGGYDGWQAEIDGQSRGMPNYIYYRVLRRGKTGIVMEGISQKNKEEDFTDFQKLSQSISFKWGSGSN